MSYVLHPSLVIPSAVHSSFTFLRLCSLSPIPAYCSTSDLGPTQLPLLFRYSLPFVYILLYSVASSAELRLLYPPWLDLSSPFVPLLLEILKISLSLAHSSLLLVTRLWFWKFWSLKFPCSLYTWKSGILEGFHREQGNTLSPPR